ncbi:MAG: glycoside hydrolase family 3 protein [Bacteroidales bacterium]|nr:glycoside hydrolase family 3 protein [Bacteroidales bacterium]
MRRTNISVQSLLLTMATLSVSVLSCSSPATDNIDKVISSMTVRQKVAQTLMIEINGQGDKEKIFYLKNLAKEGLGGIIWMDAPVDGLVQETNILQRRSRIPLLVSVDAEWGLAMRCPEYPAFPKQLHLGKIPNAEDLVYNMGKAIANELRGAGIHINFAPVVDVNSNPDVQVIGERSFGSDVNLVTDYAESYMKGMQDGGIITCAKHFPGHGEAAVDSHLGLPVLNLSRERLDSLELLPYRRLISQGVDLVMIGHLAVPSLDPSGVPASISKPIITGLLKEELGFDGIVITDALQMKGITSGRDSVQVVLEAFLAGADILLMPEDAEASLDFITSKVESGTIPMEMLDQKVRKILLLKEKAGLFGKGRPYITKHLKESVKEAVALDKEVLKTLAPYLE